MVSDMETTLPHLWYLAAPLPQRNPGLEMAAFVLGTLMRGLNYQQHGLWHRWFLPSKNPPKGSSINGVGSISFHSLSSELYLDNVHTKVALKFLPFKAPLLAETILSSASAKPVPQELSSGALNRAFHLSL